MSCCGLVKSPLVCPAGAEQLLYQTAVVGWPREMEVLSWELPCSAASAAAAVPSVVLVLINVLNQRLFLSRGLPLAVGKASLPSGVEKCLIFCLSWGEGGSGDAGCCLTCQCWGRKGKPNEGELAASWNLETNLSQCQKTLLPPRKGGSSKRSWNWLVTGLGFVLTSWISCYFKFMVDFASYPAQSLALFY